MSERKPRNADAGGFTLLELIIAMALGLIVFASVATTFTSQTRAYSAQEQINQMEQNARGALDIMSREIKMAGYKPNGGSVSGVVSYTATSLTIQADLNADGALLHLPRLDPDPGPGDESCGLGALEGFGIVVTNRPDLSLFPSGEIAQ